VQFAQHARQAGENPFQRQFFGQLLRPVQQSVNRAEFGQAHAGRAVGAGADLAGGHDRRAAQCRDVLELGEHQVQIGLHAFEAILERDAVNLCHHVLLPPRDQLRHHRAEDQQADDRLDDGEDAQRPESAPRRRARSTSRRRS
jgi:hypothetical protein